MYILKEDSEISLVSYTHYMYMEVYWYYRTVDSIICNIIDSVSDLSNLDQIWFAKIRY